MVDTGSLTKRQKEIFEYVKTYVRDHGYPPTVREIGTAVGISSTSVVDYHLRALERQGRGVRLTDEAQQLAATAQRLMAIVEEAEVRHHTQLARGRPQRVFTVVGRRTRGSVSLP